MPKKGGRSHSHTPKKSQPSSTHTDVTSTSSPTIGRSLIEPESNERIILSPKSPPKGPIEQFFEDDPSEHNTPPSVSSQASSSDTDDDTKDVDHHNGKNSRTVHTHKQETRIHVRNAPIDPELISDNEIVPSPSCWNTTFCRGMVLLFFLAFFTFEFSLIANQHETQFHSTILENRVAAYRHREIVRSMELGVKEAQSCQPKIAGSEAMKHSGERVESLLEKKKREDLQAESEVEAGGDGDDDKVVSDGTEGNKEPIQPVEPPLPPGTLPPSIPFSLLSGWLSSGRSPTADEIPSETDIGQWTACSFLDQKYSSGEPLKQLQLKQIQLEPAHSDLLDITKYSPSAAPLTHPADISRFLLSASGIACDEPIVRLQALRLKVREILESGTVDPKSTTYKTLHGVKEYLSYQLREKDPVLSIASTKLDEIQPWISSLPAEHVPDPNGKGAADFNLLSGTLAYETCKATQRLGPISTQNQRETYVPPGTEKIPKEYTEFVKEAMKGVQDEVGAEGKDQSTAGTPTPTPATTSASSTPGHEWYRPLLPTLPTSCTAASFHRPASARRCLANQRIVGFGDSTMEELTSQLVDFLESRDDELPGGDPKALEWDTPYDPKNPAHAEPKLSEVSKESQVPPSDQPSDRSMTMFTLYQWVSPLSCLSENNRHYRGRSFSTARLPSPYLSAYNITVTQQWNVHENACENWSPAIEGSKIGLVQRIYGALRGSCLPDDAIAFVKAIRSNSLAHPTGPTAGPMSQTEYMVRANHFFPWETYNQFNGPLTQLKKPDCNLNLEKYPTATKYFTDEQLLSAPVSTWFLPSDWSAHFASVPRWDHGLYTQAVHQIHQWELPPEDPAQLEAKTYTRLGLTWTRHFTRHVVVRETNYRGPHLPTSAMKSNEFLHSMVTQAEDENAKHLEVALKKALEWPSNSAGASTTAVYVSPPLCGSAGAPIDPAYGESYRQCSTAFPSPSGRPWLDSPISWVSEWSLTAATNNWGEPTHCTWHLDWPPPEIGGPEMRSPVCLQVIHETIHRMCAKKEMRE